MPECLLTAYLHVWEESSEFGGVDTTRCQLAVLDRYTVVDLKDTRTSFATKAP